MHVNTIGDMISPFDTKSRRNTYKGQYATCPRCGAQMRATAKLCYQCHLAEKRAVDPLVIEERQERQERFDLALLAGWMLEELYGGTFDPGNPQEDKLPTMNEIMGRLIKNWWAMSDNERQEEDQNG